MGPFTMVVLIVMIVGIVRIVQARHGIRPERDGEAALPPPAEAGGATRLTAELARLKDRVAVLERIVTDGDRDRGLALEREIEALRDARALARAADGEPGR